MSTSQVEVIPQESKVKWHKHFKIYSDITTKVDIYRVYRMPGTLAIPPINPVQPS